MCHSEPYSERCIFFLPDTKTEISLAERLLLVWCRVLKWISMGQRRSASKNWVGLSSPQSEWVQWLWWGANHHQSWPVSENHSGVGIEVRSETEILSFSIQFTDWVSRLSWPKTALALRERGRMVQWGGEVGLQWIWAQTCTYYIIFSIRPEFSHYKMVGGLMFLMSFIKNPLKELNIL